LQIDLFSKLGAVETSYEKSLQASATSIAQLLLGSSDLQKINMFKSALTALFYRPINDSIIKINFVVLIGIFVVFCWTAMRNRVNKLNINAVRASIILIPLGFVAYAFMMIVEYANSDRLGSFSRYLSSYSTAVIILIIFFAAFSITGKLNKKAKMVCSLTLYSLLLVFIPIRLYSYFLNTDLSAGQIDNRKKIDLQVDAVINYADSVNSPVRTYNFVFDGRAIQDWTYYLLEKGLNDKIGDLTSDRTNQASFSTVSYPDGRISRYYIDNWLNNGFTHVYISYIGAIDYSKDFRTLNYDLFDCPLEEIGIGLYEIL
jgi:hypothetical protein